MKTCSPQAPRAPLSPAAARNCLLINQFATPGLGSLMGRRWLAGLGQLLLALAGFGLVTGWFIELFLHLFNQLNDVSSTMPMPWMGEAGAGAFLLAWLWSWVTSLSLLRQARAAQPVGESKGPPVPPRLDQAGGTG